ncbi:hypothetical protein [Microbacterium terregens]|uniref:Uncharacterized protein n=1 Tax=Microbacterium terregens TaxID=69363 RepID=A0ABV5T397_9MICO
MAVPRMRAAGAALAALVLVVIGGAATPAVADDPPPVVWTPVAGYPASVGDLTVHIEHGSGDPFVDSGEPSGPTPLANYGVTNASAEPVVIGFGTDTSTQGVIEPLWEPATWGVLEEEASNGLTDYFRLTVPAGETAYLVGDSGVPEYSGRTAVIYELTPAPDVCVPEDPEDPEGPQVCTPAADPTVETEIGRYTAPGRFVPVRFDEGNEHTVFGIGQEISVAGADGAELFPGVSATVTASGLTAGEQLELWLAPNMDYFFFFLMGGVLPADAVPVGTGTVAADGTLNTTFVIPADTALNSQYQLVAGVPGEYYWPAGSYEYFQVTAPAASASVGTPEGASESTVAVGATNLTFTFPEGTEAGTTTAAVSTTGPAPNEFTLATNPPLYYHLDTTAEPGGPVTVCITYNTANLPGGPPYLYHHEPVEGGYTWTNITTSREAGRVCGVTSSFSPFTLGYPLHDGSTVKPAKGVMSDDNSPRLQDGTYNVTMDIKRGENARIVRLLENGVVVAEQELTRSTPNPQRAVFAISGKANGTYKYTAELENSTGVTKTAAHTVKVKDANPGKVMLKATSPKNGAFTLTATMSSGTNATSAQFYQNGVPLGAPMALTANTPNAQTVSLPLVRSKGNYTYKVVFANAVGATSSGDVKVKVK